jgi:hypothetical protein
MLVAKVLPYPLRRALQHRHVFSRRSTPLCFGSHWRLCCQSNASSLIAEADRLEAGGFNSLMENKPRRINSDRKAPCPLDRVNRQFKADWPDQLWASDFT